MSESIPTDRPNTIAKSALSFLSGTMVSRVTGLVRDMSMACFFGTSASIAAFFVALRFAILLRRIFGEGALLNGFVPHFETHRKADPKKAAAFFRDVFFSVTIVVVALIALSEIILSFWLPNQIVYLVMLILPGVPFICLFGICSGLLHCEKYFFLTGVAPVAYNIIWIGAVWILRNELPQVAAVGLSVSISFAFFFQWLITFPKTLAFTRQFLSGKEFLAVQPFSPEIRRMFTSLSLGVIGVAAAQINSAIDPLFARYSSLEGPAYLNYAIHLQQLPLALFGVGVASALLPPLSRAFASEDSKRSGSLLEFAISNTLLVILPCAIAIFALGAASVNLIYGRGDFSQISSQQTTYCLWGYGIGLLPMVITLLLAPAFYAKKDYRTPTICSVISILAGLGMNTLLICFMHLGPSALAFSTSASACLNATLLYYFLSSKTGIHFSSEFFASAFSTVICSFIAGSATLWVGYAFFSDPTLSLIIQDSPVFVREGKAQIFQFCTLFSTFSASFLLSALCLKREEIFALVEKFKSVR